ncbi:AAA-ATPase ASD, mitochondrial-like [Prosopis cineraria]|uniref:AAA-ATPase ASD, mitochondrial-like n=1 Tax=Prosopis cineraria TaxID=364024 RepID=UPI00240ECD5B|nr:AAA-ATPase ASD, mitochondrial-like [Prosopis cineraria]
MEMHATMWSQLGSITATVMFLYAMFDRFFPPPLRDYLKTYTRKLTSLISPYISIKFPEFEGERMKRSEAFTAIQTYLSANSSERVSRLKAEVVKDSQTPLVLSMDDNEEITDEFQGAKLWWAAHKHDIKNQSFSFYPSSDEKHFYKLTFHKRHRDVVTRSYVKHVLDEGKAIATRNRQLKLYTNNPSGSWYGWKRTKWSHVVFEHPASFDTLALDPKMKEDIIKDLVMFQKGKEYYAKIGKAWKRGYLLYGPPGTGKSTMIAAMANFLNYDIYDLELTAVKENAELRKLLIETTSKSIVVIEDIDCSLDLTRQRKKKKKEEEGSKDPVKKALDEDEDKESKVTLSGLLNVIDGIWSACGGERVIVFTTNYVDKLDPALIRRGRMDKHIELSYCCYEAFKVLARNYLDIETPHHLYPRIEELFRETEMTPADVAENLMPKSMEEDVETCLERLVESLETTKLEAKKKAEEEAKKKAEEEVKEKQEDENNRKSGGVKENGSLSAEN